MAAKVTRACKFPAAMSFHTSASPRYAIAPARRARLEPSGRRSRYTPTAPTRIGPIRSSFNACAVLSSRTVPTTPTRPKAGGAGPVACQPASCQPVKNSRRSVDAAGNGKSWPTSGRCPSRRLRTPNTTTRTTPATAQPTLACRWRAMPIDTVLLGWEVPSVRKWASGAGAAGPVSSTERRPPRLNRRATARSGCWRTFPSALRAALRLLRRRRFHRHASLTSLERSRSPLAKATSTSALEATASWSSTNGRRGQS